MAESLRQQLRRVVLESGTPAGRIYNLVIFGTILLSVVGCWCNRIQCGGRTR